MSDFSRIMELALAGNAAKTQEAMGGPVPALTDATAKPAAPAAPPPAPAPASAPPQKK